MSDYQLPEVWENPAQMGGLGALSINQLLVLALSSIYLRATNPSSSIPWEHQMASRLLSCLKN